MSLSAIARRLAPAKINLFLHVGVKRSDGYHELLSLAVFADVGDWLTANPAAALSLDVAGPFAKALDDGTDNLVTKAARALSAWAAANGFKAGGAAMTLEKNLPVASGIGGGSSDAAAALLLLAELWSLPVGMELLREMGLTLGADIPVCLNARPTLMSGIGDILKPAPELPPFALVLVNPGVAVPTAQVFKALRTHTGTVEPKTFKGGTAHEFALWLDQTSNDLAAPAIAVAPVITQVEAAITASENCLLARMSGSGATCFGLYATYDQAISAANTLAKANPDWWVRPARTYVRDQ